MKNIEKVRRVLLVGLSDRAFYEGTMVKSAVYEMPSLTIATLAGAVKVAGNAPEAFEYDLYVDGDGELVKQLESLQPDVVAITFVNTPLFDEMVRVTKLVKSLNSGISVIAGGAHATCFPEDCINGGVDVVVRGEGDLTLPELLVASPAGWPPGAISGVSFRGRDGRIVSTEPRQFIEELDELPLPSWEIFDLKKYRRNRLTSRENPVGWIETSRGCPYSCVYCNKNIFGRTYRVKSPQRVVKEMEYMLDAGFREIHIADDGFTTDMKRAEKICDLMIEKKLRFPWSTPTGIRADRVSKQLLEKMARAGCYRVYYGVESGNQEILNRIHKQVKLEEVRNAVRWAKEAGMETFGFFMIGLPGETEETMRDTIDFAKELELDLVKMSITMPLPGTPLYAELKQKGLIKSNKWSQFNFYVPPREAFDHENLDWDAIEKYYKLFYREFYFRPGYILKRFLFGLSHGTLLTDVGALVSTRW